MVYLFLVYYFVQTFAETEKRHWDCKENEWEREKQKILNALLGSGQDSVDFQPETEVGNVVSIKKKGDIVFNGSKEIFVLSWSFNSLIHVWPYPSDNIYLDTGIWKALFKKSCDKKIKYCIYVVILWYCSLQFPVFTIHTYYLFRVIFSRVSWWTQYPCKVEVLWTIWRWLTLDRFVHCVSAYNKLNNAI